MANRLDYAKAKRMKAASERGAPPQENDWLNFSAVGRWRVTDGREYPVTITTAAERSRTGEEADDGPA